MASGPEAGSLPYQQPEDATEQPFGAYAPSDEGDWARLTFAKAPKFFKHPSPRDVGPPDGMYHDDRDRHDVPEEPRDRPAHDDGRDEHSRKDAKAFKWAKHLFHQSKKDLKKKTVWEIMLYACNKTETRGPHSHKEYYEAWRDYASVRRVYSKLEIEPRYNPCKYYREWHHDTSITFGVVVSRRGVIDQATMNGGNPLGLAFPQVVVREGSALVAYSYAGPGKVPGTSAMAFPGKLCCCGKQSRLLRGL